MADSRPIHENFSYGLCVCPDRMEVTNGIYFWYMKYPNNGIEFVAAAWACPGIAPLLLEAFWKLGKDLVDLEPRL